MRGKSSKKTDTIFPLPLVEIIDYREVDLLFYIISNKEKQNES